jgi:hypothetical protein
MVDSASRCPVHFTRGFISAGHDCARRLGRPDEVFHFGRPASLIAALSRRCLGVGSVSTPQRLVRPERDQFRTGAVAVPGPTRATVIAVWSAIHRDDPAPEQTSLTVLMPGANGAGRP